MIAYAHCGIFEVPSTSISWGGLLCKHLEDAEEEGRLHLSRGRPET